MSKSGAISQQESRFWTLTKTLMTMGGTVLTGVLIWYFTTPRVYPAIGLMGVVSDATTSQPINDALVTAAAATSIASTKTDNEGRYSFVLNGTKSGSQSVTVDVLASGYPQYRSPAFSITTGDNFGPIRVPRHMVISPAPAPNEGGTPGEGSSIPVRRMVPQISKIFPSTFQKPAVTVKLK